MPDRNPDVRGDMGTDKEIGDLKKNIRVRNQTCSRPLIMPSQPAKFLFKLNLLMFSIFIAPQLCAQVAGVTLSGTVTGPSGAVVANANVSVKSGATGQTTESQTDPAGMSNVPALAAGDYEVSVSADGFGGKVTPVTLTAGPRQTMDLALASSSNPAPPSLGDLGF